MWFKFEEGVKLQMEINEFSLAFKNMVRKSTHSTKELASYFECSPSTINRIVRGAGFRNVSLETLGYLALACGYKLEVRLVKCDTTQ